MNKTEFFNSIEKYNERHKPLTTATIKKFEKSFIKRFGNSVRDIGFDYDHLGNIYLYGETDHHSTWYEAGNFASGYSNFDVGNHILYPAKITIEHSVFPLRSEKNTSKTENKDLQGKRHDIIIIGGGIIGNMILSELSRYNLDIALVEKHNDVAYETSSRNDGMVHPGINPSPGSLKAIMNVRGNYLFEKKAQNLNVPFNRCGSYVILTNPLLKLAKPIILWRAKKNRVPGVSILSGKNLMKSEPNIALKNYGAIHLPSASVCPPYKMTVACAEHAIVNGANIYLNTEVQGFIMEGKSIKEVKTNRGNLKAKYIVNAAGLFSDTVANMAGDQFFSIHPRKGVIMILDKRKSKVVKHIIGSLGLRRDPHSKGGGLVHTYEGNILVGPTAEEIPVKDDYSVKQRDIENLMKKFFPLVKDLTKLDVITFFTGIRAASFKEDFVIHPGIRCENIFHLGGIQSPGYASSPAIAEYVADFIKNRFSAQLKKDFSEKYEPAFDIQDQPLSVREKMIQKDKDYSTIICRCEKISVGEIKRALGSPLPPTDLDGIKRRTRAQMGRCQGGFCTPKIIEIMAENQKINPLNITKKGENSALFVNETKEKEIYSPASNLYHVCNPEEK